MKVKTKNGFPVWHFFLFGMFCRQIGPHPMQPYALDEWRRDSSLKQFFSR